MEMDKRLLAKPITKKIFAEIKEITSDTSRHPKLNIVVLGEDPAAAYYVNNLIKKGKKVGIDVEAVRLSAELSQDALVAIIEKMNDDNNVDAIMLQKPLPKHIDDELIVEKLNPKKDVDGLHPLNLGNLILNKDGFVPCTPGAVLQILDYYEIETNSKNVVILGRSNIVGKPLANLLLRKDKTGNSTVTVCHSRTQNLQKITSQADILIAAIGKPNFVVKNMLKPEAIVIDVGINQVVVDGQSKYVGDVNYEDCFSKAKLITPVPGGVGSVTTAMLLKNVMKAYLNGQK